MLEIQTALTALNATWSIAKGALDARDDAKAKAAVSDMARLLLDAHKSALALAGQVNSLQSQLAELQAQYREVQRSVAEREQYALHEIVPGAFVYRFKLDAEGIEQGAIPVHYLCQNCFDRGVKSVLRRRHPGGMAAAGWLCAEAAGHSLITGV